MLPKPKIGTRKDRSAARLRSTLREQLLSDPVLSKADAWVVRFYSDEGRKVPVADSTSFSDFKQAVEAYVRIATKMHARLIPRFNGA